jgi:hypothetical protein
LSRYPKPGILVVLILAKRYNQLKGGKFGGITKQTAEKQAFEAGPGDY